VTIGITPFGGVVVQNSPTQLATGQQGQVPADGRFRTLHVTTTGSSVASVTLDGNNLTMTSAGATDFTTPSGYNTGLMLFNDYLGRTRLDAAIRRVQFTTSNNLQMTYPFNEGHGAMVAAEVSDPDLVL